MARKRNFAVSLDNLALSSQLIGRSPPKLLAFPAFAYVMRFSF